MLDILTCSKTISTWGRTQLNWGRTQLPSCSTDCINFLKPAYSKKQPRFLWKQPGNSLYRVFSKYTAHDSWCENRHVTVASEPERNGVFLTRSCVHVTDISCGVVYEATLASLVLFRSYCYVSRSLFAQLKGSKGQLSKFKVLGPNRSSKIHTDKFVCFEFFGTNDVSHAREPIKKREYFRAEKKEKSRKLPISYLQNSRCSAQNDQ